MNVNALKVFIHLPKLHLIVCAVGPIWIHRPAQMTHGIFHLFPIAGIITFASTLFFFFVFFFLFINLSKQELMNEYKCLFFKFFSSTQNSAV